ncbi:hypothetical protein [Amycolatopsis sp. CA-230715]|uniref:hypothetical protein n=1 Tax=Amycolatopsis sp. CA-230715 TaxID=2745196 RepID=UPI001C0291FC|nr:hypothetical protein [Amycolatopsis sp. CA-230715]QWF79190.1 hypothetical protein HUW46_02597 [Amycolatopsis sp. CA-230715]
MSPSTSAGPLTAAEALGDFATIDFRSLLGATGAEPSLPGRHVSATLVDLGRNAEPAGKADDCHDALPTGVSVERSFLADKQ